MTVKHLCKLIIISFCAMLGTIASAQESRFALVIGNSDYETLPSLRNPQGDANTMSVALANLGFTVYLANNLTQVELEDALKTYEQKSQHADISLLYYAGHGGSLGSQNLIFPTDFDFQNPNQLRSLVSLSDISKLMHHGTRTNIIIFDACQEPIAIQTPNGVLKLESIAPNIPPVGTLISYASAHGKAAHDGTGNHSVFTGALLDNLALPDIDIEQTLRIVRRDVIKNSQGTQVPQTSSSLVSDFILYPTKASAHSQTLQQALSENGFSKKPILSQVANGLEMPSSGSQLTTEKAILRDILCETLSAPLPEICKK